MQLDLAIVLTTVSDDEQAEALADILVQSNYIACINILPNIKSKYIWKGELKNTQESLLIIKTKKQFFHSIEEIIKRNHKYEIPEIICIDISNSSKDYGNWLINNLTGD